MRGPGTGPRGGPAALLLDAAPPDGAPDHGGSTQQLAPRHLAVGRTSALRYLHPSGPLLSTLFATEVWDDVTCAFAPGDTLLAFTDGLLEARDARGEQFGLGRVRQVLAQERADTSRRVLDALAAAGLRHGPAHLDDQTLVCVRRTPTSVLTEPADRVVPVPDGLSGPAGRRSAGAAEVRSGV